jgi:hypothetical protein
MLATILSQNAASACVPASLVGITVKAAASIAAGKAVGSAIVSAKVAAPTEGVLRTMLMTKLKTLTAVIVVALGFMIGGGVLFHHETVAAQEAEPKVDVAREAKPDRQEAVEAVDKEKQLTQPRDILVLSVKGVGDAEIKKKLEGGGGLPGRSIP